VLEFDSRRGGSYRLEYVAQTGHGLAIQYRTYPDANMKDSC
jgi:hypothetical protein